MRRDPSSLVCLVSGSLLLAGTGCVMPAAAPSAPTSRAVQAIAVQTVTPAPSSGVVTINAVGDLMLDRDVERLMEERGGSYPFEKVQALLADADITVANLEGTLSDRGEAAAKSYTFRTAPRAAWDVAKAGIDVVSLANNHSTDFGEISLLDTIDALDAAGVRHAGAGSNGAEAHQPVLVEANGLRLAFLSYNAVPGSTAAGDEQAGVAWADEDVITRDVEAAEGRADAIVVLLHAGVEYQDAPNPEQRSLARAAIDAGASLVLGHHAHVLQGWEQYRGGVIVYGLGNFVFDLDADDLVTLGPRPFQTAVLRVTLDRNGVTEVRARPVFIDPEENRPLPADPDQAQQIEDRIATLNAALDE